MTTMHAMHAGTQSTTKALKGADMLARNNADWLAFQAELQERIEMDGYEVREAEPDNELAEAMIQAVYDKAL